MAKELPYFKFEPNQWENGSIQFFNRQIKGLFIDLCSMYWSRVGELDYALALQKLCNGNAEEFDLLIQRDLFYIQDDKIIIDFLDEQLNEFQKTSVKRSDAANKRWNNANALQKESKSNAIREEKIREEERKEKKIIPINTKFDNFDEVFNCYSKCLTFFSENLHPKTEKIKENWIDTIEKLNRIDKIPFEKIIEIVQWARNDSFWGTNFLSIPKLRTKDKQKIMYIVVFNEKIKGSSPTNYQEYFNNETASDAAKSFKFQ